MIGSAWTVYILECADGSYRAGMTQNLKKMVSSLNTMKDGIYQSRHPKRFPVTVQFSEGQLRFREAFAKATYLKEMNRRLRKKLICTKKWPIGGALLEYIRTTPIENLE
jgi:predicted GIY-YIG superfamily endonuclease